MTSLRFRAWHKDLYDGKIFTDFNLSAEGEILFSDEIDGDWPAPKGTVVMLFSGLEDEDGKEIWEHDIVEISTGTAIVRSVVYFGFGEFSVDPEGSGHYGSEHLLSSNHHNCKVIGNIHEQPEVLTA